MKKYLFFGLLAILTVFLTACSDFDLSGVSDADLSRISEVAVVCNAPYIRFGTGCCIDQNNNGICDNDERVNELEAEPTASNPITLQQQVEISRNKEKTMSIGFYNRNPNTALRATFTISECLDSTGTAVTPDKVPSISSTKYDVGPSSAKVYSIIAKENGLQAGTYICTMVVCEQTACQQNTYEKKQFFLQVIA